MRMYIHYVMYMYMYTVYIVCVREIKEIVYNNAIVLGNTTVWVNCQRIPEGNILN